MSDPKPCRFCDEGTGDHARCAVAYRRGVGDTLNASAKEPEGDDRSLGRTLLAWVDCEDGW